MKTTRTVLLSTIAAGALVACGNDQASTTAGAETENQQAYTAERMTTQTAEARSTDQMSDRDNGMENQPGMYQSDADRAQMDAQSDRMPTDRARQSPMMTVEVTGVEPNAGDVFVAVQNRDNFAENAATEGVRVAASGETISVPLENLAPGAYAVAVFQDLDGNGQLTFDGQTPAEPYGFSGREQTGAPDYNRAEVDVLNNPAQVTVSLKPVTAGDRG